MATERASQDGPQHPQLPAQPAGGYPAPWVEGGERGLPPPQPAVPPCRSTAPVVPGPDLTVVTLLCRSRSVRAGFPSHRITVCAGVGGDSAAHPPCQCARGSGWYFQRLLLCPPGMAPRSWGSRGGLRPPTPWAQAPHISPDHLSLPSVALGIPGFALSLAVQMGKLRHEVTRASLPLHAPAHHPVWLGQGGVVGEHNRHPKRWIWPITVSRAKQGEERCRRWAPALANPLVLPPPSSSACCWGCRGGSAPPQGPTSLWGRPAAEKMGIFWPRAMLFITSMGEIPVWIISSG